MIDQTSPAAQITQMLSTPATKSDEDIMGRDDFLQVLITQLRYQDPMEPLSQSEMIGQLTQFNILDELRSMNGNIEDSISQDLDNVSLLAALQQAVINGQSVSLIGRHVEAESDTVTVDGGESPTYSVSVPTGASSVTVTLLDANGNEVASETLGTSSGTVEFQPPVSGLADGEYQIRVEAASSDGETTVLPARLTGTVTALRFGSRGTVLEVAGQEISLADIVSISMERE